MGSCDTTLYSAMMREAYPVPRRYSSVKEALNEAVRFISPRVRKEFTHRRARSIWEGTARRIDAEEAAVLGQAKIEEARREYRELQSRLAKLEASLAMADQEMAGATVVAHRALAHGVGRMDRSRNGGAIR